MTELRIACVALVVVAVGLAGGCATQDEATTDGSGEFTPGGVWLGVVTAELSSSQAARLGLHKGRALLVHSVTEGGPMHRAGLREHDVLVAFAGKRVNSAEDLLNVTLRLKPGQVVPVTFLRKGEMKTVDVQVEARPAPSPPTPPRETAPPAK
ncbi:MAG: PDZ domain-containing protein [Planctomycetes bacterium]|nr:PDZ domain-containing protein [Planctomycetota bacterium]MBM4084030.1 PDZ domain-containing protein [Planctomycetota bacterium]